MWQQSTRNVFGVIERLDFKFNFNQFTWKRLTWLGASWRAARERDLLIQCGLESFKLGLVSQGAGLLAGDPDFHSVILPGSQPRYSWGLPFSRDPEQQIWLTQWTLPMREHDTGLASALPFFLSFPQALPASVSPNTISISGPLMLLQTQLRFPASELMPSDCFLSCLAPTAE